MPALSACAFAGVSFAGVSFARVSFAGVSFAAVSFAAVSFDTRAQTYPARPVKMIVPYPPGGFIDGVARGLAQKLGETWASP